MNADNDLVPNIQQVGPSVPLSVLPECHHHGELSKNAWFETYLVVLFSPRCFRPRLFLLFVVSACILHGLQMVNFR